MNPNKILKNTRKLLGMNQVMFAKEFKISQGALSKYESGQMDLPLPVFLHLLKFWIEKLSRE